MAKYLGSGSAERGVLIPDVSHEPCKPTMVECDGCERGELVQRSPDPVPRSQPHTSSTPASPTPPTVFKCGCYDGEHLPVVWTHPLDAERGDVNVQLFTATTATAPEQRPRALAEFVRGDGCQLSLTTHLFCLDFRSCSLLYRTVFSGMFCCAPFKPPEVM